jgi:hypothetical protein
MDFTSRNLGYYDCRANQRGTPIYNLRMFGMLAVMTYRDGKLVEDITPEYLDYVADTIPPRACAVDLVDAPEGLQQAVRAGHYGTRVSCNCDKVRVAVNPEMNARVDELLGPGNLRLLTAARGANGNGRGNNRSRSR